MAREKRPRAQRRDVEPVVHAAARSHSSTLLPACGSGLNRGDSVAGATSGVEVTCTKPGCALPGILLDPERTHQRIWTLVKIRARQHNKVARCRECDRELKKGDTAYARVTNALDRANRVCAKCANQIFLTPEEDAVRKRVDAKLAE